MGVLEATRCTDVGRVLSGLGNSRLRGVDSR